MDSSGIAVFPIGKLPMSRGMYCNLSALEGAPTKDILVGSPSIMIGFGTNLLSGTTRSLVVRIAFGPRLGFP